MGRNIRLSRAEYPFRAMSIMKEYVKNERLVEGAKYRDVFYVKEIENTDSNLVVGGNAKTTIKQLQIETPDYVNVRPDDFVYYKGHVYKIDTLFNKIVNKRGRDFKYTTINMSRRVDNE